jgi:HD-like signal output (HDOD) protein
MTGSSVVYLKPRNRQEEAAPQSPRVLTALGSALLRMPARPTGLAACVAYLQESAELLAVRPIGLRALSNLRDILFVAPGRDIEMRVLWRESLATACCARLAAMQMQFSSPLLTGAGLLHRLGDVTALRALATSEIASGQRLVGPVMQEVATARDQDLANRVLRHWSLAPDLKALILGWRDDPASGSRPESLRLLMLAQALAMEVVHANTAAPGLADAACEALSLPAGVIAQMRALSAGIEALLTEVAPTIPPVQ